MDNSEPLARHRPGTAGALNHFTALLKHEPVAMAAAIGITAAALTNSIVAFGLGMAITLVVANILSRA